MKNKPRKKFRWACAYERLYHNPIFKDECCTVKSKKCFGTKEEAARHALNNHPHHADSLFVYNTKKQYAGLAVGINAYAKS